MDKFIKKHKNYWINKSFSTSVFWGLLLLTISLAINYAAGIYATNRASNAVTDIILSNIRVFDVDGILIYGSMLFGIGLFILILYEPKRIPFVLKSIALFVIIRSMFVILTHIAPSLEKIPLDPGRILSKLIFGGDLFFSGHTGLPFLMALIFWQNKYLRNIFLAISVTFGITVLLGHFHYSIDVFAAYFITYTIFHIAQKFFKKDYELLLNEN